MIFKDISFPDPAANILYDDVLLSLAETQDSGSVLRLWESLTPFVVLGRTSCLEEDVHLEAVRRDGIPVLRRSSGGGTVLQGRGCLNFSFVFSKQNYKPLNDLRGSYSFILGEIVQLLGEVGVLAIFRPVSDMATQTGERKFSGNAQHRRRNYVLHHGTILYDFDLALISRYLRFPKATPAYRCGRSHEDFLCNISVSAAVLRAAFQKKFCASPKTCFPTEEEQGLLRELVQKQSPDSRGEDVLTVMETVDRPGLLSIMKPD